MTLFNQNSFTYLTRVDSGHEKFMRHAITLAQKAFGETSPNPQVGALVVKNGRILGKGWHHKAGLPHAEIEALQDAVNKGRKVAGADLYVTLEPCSTHGRTPPCTAAVRDAGIKRVFVGARDPNPLHAGRGLTILGKPGIEVVTGILREECENLNTAWNHWIVQRTPFVTLKCAMTLDGKIATAAGESKWITSEQSRAYAMRLRQSADAILVGVNTIVADDPSLTIRGISGSTKSLRRIVLDPTGRTPRSSKLLTDPLASNTTIVVDKKITPLLRFENNVSVWGLNRSKSGFDLASLLKRLGEENVTHLLVEGGGEVNAAFLSAGLVSRAVFFYAPKVLAGKDARKAVGGPGAASLAASIRLTDVQWRQLGPDLVMEAKPCYQPRD